MTTVSEHSNWCIYILWNVGIESGFTLKDVAAFCDLVPLRTKIVIKYRGYQCV